MEVVQYCFVYMYIIEVYVYIIQISQRNEGRGAASEIDFVLRPHQSPATTITFLTLLHNCSQALCIIILIIKF